MERSQVKVSRPGDNQQETRSKADKADLDKQLQSLSAQQTQLKGRATADALAAAQCYSKLETEVTQLERHHRQLDKDKVAPERKSCHLASERSLLDSRLKESEEQVIELEEQNRAAVLGASAQAEGLATERSRLYDRVQERKQLHKQYDRLEQAKVKGEGRCKRCHNLSAGAAGMGRVT